MDKKDLEYAAEEARKHALLAQYELHSAHFLMHRVLRTATTPAITKDAHAACEYVWKALGELQEITDEIYGATI